ncbi:MAG TPA: tetratricopeptide repeat protein, partial [Terriglobia bacterium]|nr:tetratricopeptide repeat protein [Terriglobia bacterium]
NLGLVYYLQSNFEKSSQALAKAAALKPGLRGTDLFLGMDYVRLHRARNAVPRLTRAIEEEPNNEQAQLSLGAALWNSGQEAAALRQLRKTARLFPSDVESLYALGEAYQKSANQQLEKLPPKYAELLRKGAYPPEWKDFNRRAQGMTGPYSQALADFGRKDYEPAEEKLVAFLAVDPDRAEARYLLAKTYEHLSLSILSRMYQVDPNSYRVHQLLGRIYEYRWQNDKALAEYRTVERMRPALPGIHLAAGEVLWREEQLDPALTEFKAEIKLDPYDARPYAEMGTVLVAKHESEKAISYLTKALQLQPDLLLDRKYLGIAYYRQKDYARAEQEFKKALPIDRDGSVHYLLGVVYRALGRPKEAKAEMEEARLIQAASERRAEVKTENAATLKQ